ncbi:protein of unknown function [Candidatus Filomicrobium marinum]|uniref:Uncharacterized protein n=1 Tax=Candidatus Filomicrobium marinum TaxID=1608628 RepID=A0A0D6JAB0_9HYPH|nr:protein of unknown function [Candidatus Filomicrobium marinum]CPR15412.1 protein of unknown function [Candidatus Filomicrobium marinum]
MTVAVCSSPYLANQFRRHLGDIGKSTTQKFICHLPKLGRNYLAPFLTTLLEIGEKG